LTRGRLSEAQQCIGVNLRWILSLSSSSQKNR
jgi:hypothetical protein